MGPKPYSTYNFEFLSLPLLEESDLEYDSTVKLRVFSALSRVFWSLALVALACVRVLFLVWMDLSTSAGDGPPCTL